MNKDTNTIVTMERTVNTPLSVLTREDGTESRTIEGYAILFNQESLPLWDDEDGSAVEVIAPEAVTRELLDNSDIKMTMFHDRQLILARSKNGEGTLSYEIDETGVKFRFDAPHTADGNKALELVKRGDIAGCSFAFSTRYYDRDFVTHETTYGNGKCTEKYTVRTMLGVYDFTLAADPAYPQTSVGVRELRESTKAAEENKKADLAIREQQKKEMKMAAAWRL